MFGLIPVLFWSMVALLYASDDENPKAHANILFADHSEYPTVIVAGTVDFEEINNTITKVSVKLTGIDNYSGILPPDEHGIHIHTRGTIEQLCEATGSHYNPNLFPHADTDSYLRHIGDMGNWRKTDDNAISEAKTFYENRLPLTGRMSVIGRSVVVHRKRDDLGLNGDQDGLETGNSGKPIACGVIGKANHFNITLPDQEINPIVRYPVHAIAHMFNSKEYMGNISILQDSPTSGPRIRAQVSGFRQTPEYRYLIVYETGKLSWQRGCSQMGEQRAIDKGKGALAKMNIYGNAISGTFEVSYDIDFFGPDSIVGLGLGLSTTDVFSHGYSCDSCGVIGINSDFSASGAGMISFSLQILLFAVVFCCLCLV